MNMQNENSKVVRHCILKKLSLLAKPRLVHEPPFDKFDYVSAYDDYKKYIMLEPESERENIIAMLIESEENLFLGEFGKPGMNKELRDFEEKYNKMKFYDKHKAISLGPTIKLPRYGSIRKKDLKELLLNTIPEYLPDYKYDKKPYSDSSPDLIVFSKIIKEKKWIIEFDKGSDLPTRWVAIYFGLSEPLRITKSLSSCLNVYLLFFENLQECNKNLQLICKDLKRLVPIFADKIEEGLEEGMKLIKTTPE